MKKTLSTILAVLLIISIIPTGLFGITASAATYRTDGNFRFEVRGTKLVVDTVYVGIPGDVVIPSTSGNYEVVGITREAFAGCSKMTSIVIPDTVKWIEERAFSGCAMLKSVTFGNGVASIGYGAFYGCSSLTNIVIPNGVTSIEQLTFSACRLLKSITIPNSITNIGFCAFEYCTSLVTVYYNGTKEQWKSIKINNEQMGNDYLLCSNIVYNSK